LKTVQSSVHIVGSYGFAMDFPQNIVLDKPLGTASDGYWWACYTVPLTGNGGPIYLFQPRQIAERTRPQTGRVLFLRFFPLHTHKFVVSFT
jgi:hypothetical protein